MVFRLNVKYNQNNDTMIEYDSDVWRAVENNEPMKKNEDN
jgi:hypothetical protein